MMTTCCNINLKKRLSISVTVLICIFSGNVHAQLDTAKLRQMVPSTTELYAQKHFWDFIDQRDQDSRRSPMIERMDEENLIMVCHYFNAFGYPDFRRLGDRANIINMVWAHNRYADVDRLTAPIIMEGYAKGAISEETFREYYLRVLYQRSYDDHRNETDPFDTLYKMLGLTMSSHIAVDSVLASMERNRRLEADTANFIGTWYTEAVKDTILFHGKQMLVNQEQIPIRIFQVSDQRYYLKWYYPDNSYDAREVIRDPGYASRYIEKGVTSGRYYEIDEAGDLVYVIPARNDRRRYHKAF